MSTLLSKNSAETRQNASDVNSHMNGAAAEDDGAQTTLTTMDSERRESARRTVGKFSMNGTIYAGVYVYESNPSIPSPQNVEDAESVIELFKDLNCKILSEDESSLGEMQDSQSGDDLTSDDDISDNEEQCKNRKPIKKLNVPKKHHELVIVNQRSKDTARKLKEIAEKSKKPDPSCFILYFIVKHVGSSFKNHENQDLDVFQLWKEIQGLSVPVIFFIQANLSGDADVISVLLNSDKKGSRETTIAESADVLLVYLPNSENLNVPVPKILRDELCKNLDIHTSLTNVIRKVNVKGCGPGPKFSSTLTKQLHLTKGDPVEPPVKYSCGKKYLAYAFLFGKFSPELKAEDLCDIMHQNEKSLKVLEEFGVELKFCVDNWKMKKKEFKKKLREILRNKDLDSCDGIFIIVATHGWENLALWAYDDYFSVDFIWKKLAKCTKLKDKPKVIISNACRGCLQEGTFKVTVSSSEEDETQDIPAQSDCLFKNIIHGKRPRMVDILIGLSAVEGKKSYGFSYGSPFIYHLCQTLKTHGKEDFLTILTITMNRVSLLNTIKYKQQVTFTSTLRKLLYLPEKQGQ